MAPPSGNNNVVVSSNLKLERLLSMKGGKGEASYANNSQAQVKVYNFSISISITILNIYDKIRRLCSTSIYICMYICTYYEYGLVLRWDPSYRLYSWICFFFYLDPIYVFFFFQRKITN